MAKSGKKFVCVLYPDAENYNCADVLSALLDRYEMVAYILHDKDVFLQSVYDDDDKLIHSAGELKKPHYHVVFSPHGLSKDASPSTIDKISKDIGLAANYIQTCSEFKGSIRYLTHIDYQEKFQYNISDIVTNFDLKKYFKGDYQDADEFLEISEYIVKNRVTSLWQINRLLRDRKDLFATFRRSSAWFAQLIRENAAQSAKAVDSDQRDYEKYVASHFIEDYSINFDDLPVEPVTIEEQLAFDSDSKV